MQTAPCTRCREEMARIAAVDGHGIHPHSPNKAFGDVEVGDWKLCNNHGRKLNASRRKQEQRFREKEQRATLKGEVCYIIASCWFLTYVTQPILPVWCVLLTASYVDKGSDQICKRYMKVMFP